MGTTGSRGIQYQCESLGIYQTNVNDWVGYNADEIFEKDIPDKW